MTGECLCMDVGGSSIKYAVIDSQLRLRDKGNVPTPYEGIETYLSTLSDIYDRFRDQVCGIALSVPGIIDSYRGVCVTGGSLTYVENFHLVEELQKQCPVPVSIMNDAKCAALAEATWGSLADCQDGIVLVLGTGIGGAIIKDGEVHMGKHFAAGEFSFITMDENIDMGTTWATLSGRKRLETMAARVKGKKEGTVTGLDLFGWVGEGDRDACRVLDQFTRTLARMIMNLQFVYDPERFAIGGGISCQPLLLDYIQRNLDDFYKLYPYLFPRAKIVNCKFYNDANLLGAYGNFLRTVST